MENFSSNNDEVPFPVSSEEESESQGKEYRRSKPFEDVDEWMRDDALSLGEDDDEEEEEKDALLPFGLNQSWPRVSQPSRKQTAPSFRKAPLLRQISQESLDESNSLLRDHVVMLPNVPQELEEGPVKSEDSKLSLFTCPAQTESCMKEMSEMEKGIFGEQIFVPIKECDFTADFDTKEAEDQKETKEIDDTEGMSLDVKGLESSALPRSMPLMAWEDVENGTNSNDDIAVGKSHNFVKSSNDNYDKSCVDEDNCVSEMIANMMLNDQYSSLLQDDSSNKPTCSSVVPEELELNAQNDNQVSEMIYSMMVNDDQELHVESSAQNDNQVSEMIYTMIINDDQVSVVMPGKEGKDENNENDLTCSFPCEISPVVKNENSCLMKDSKVSSEIKDDATSSNKKTGPPLENSPSDETGLLFVKKHQPVQRGRNKPPLLRHISQESIEESTNLLKDHVVLVNLHSDQDEEKETPKSGQSVYLMDIAEDPLADKCAEPEEEDKFLYKGEVDSSDDAEENDDDEQSTTENGTVQTLTDMISSSIVSDEAASALQDIELIRVELDNAILDFQNLKECFPERAAEAAEPLQSDNELESEIEKDTVSNNVDCDEDGSVANEDTSCFNNLPEEVILHIFRYLSHTELCRSLVLVCKKWHHLALDPFLWQHLDLSFKFNFQSELMGPVFQRCSLLQRVTFRGRDEVYHSEIRSMVENCPNIRDIDMGFTSGLEDSMFSLIVSSCQMITSLNVEGCEEITESFISRLILLPRLKVLGLSHCTKLTDNAVIEIARFCEHLEKLDIDGIPWISDRAVIILSEERRATLRCLKLDGAELTDTSVRRVIRCPELEELNISFCEQLTDATLDTLKEWKMPRGLRLQKGKEFSEAALTNLFLFDNLSFLTYLNMSECSELRDRALINIANRCPYLIHLAIEWNWFITDVSLAQVVDKCRYLECLDLIGLHSILGDCLADIPTKLPLLTFLDLRQCNKITDSMLVQIVSMKHDLVIMNYYGEEVTHSEIPGTLVL